MVFNYVSMQGVPLYVPAVIGDLALQSSNSVDITGGSISNITDLAVADGGTGSSTQAGARANLGATAIGNALFTAANEAAARTAIGAMSTTTPEIITNANGTAYRWPNGLQICTYTQDALSISLASGSSTSTLSRSFPASFNSTAIVFGSAGLAISGSGTRAGNVEFKGPANPNSDVASWVFQISNRDSVAGTANIAKLHLIAIGSYTP